MLVSTVLPVLAILHSALGAMIPSRTQSLPRDTTPALVDRALADLTLCITLRAAATVSLAPLVVAPINVVLGQGLCLCAVAGVLTDKSAADLALQLDSQTKAVADLLDVLDADLVVNLLEAAALVLLGQRRNENTCPTYPPGAIPQCGSCAFTCPEALPQRCGESCLLADDVCPTASFGRRNHILRSENPHLFCSKGLSACAVPEGLTRSIGRVECLDTTNDVESCGGCQYPLPGQKKGTDCTAIEGAEGVSCVRGKCVVEACEVGLVVRGNTCVPALII